MLTIRNTVAIALLAVAFLFASGSFVAISAQTSVPNEEGDFDGDHENIVEELGGLDSALSASARVTLARPALQAINMTDGVQNRLKPSSKLTADLRKRGGNKQVDRKADRVLDAHARR